MRSRSASELATPLQPDTVDELRWYFTSVVDAHGAPSTDDERCIDGPDVASARPGFGRCIGPGWKTATACSTRHVTTSSATPSTARADGLECHVLPHQYLHLSPLVGTCLSRPTGEEEGEQGPCAGCLPLGMPRGELPVRVLQPRVRPLT